MRVTGLSHRALFPLERRTNPAQTPSVLESDREEGLSDCALGWCSYLRENRGESEAFLRKYRDGLPFWTSPLSRFLGDERLDLGEHRINVEAGGVDDDGIGGGQQRRGGAFAVAPVALAEFG